MKNRRILAALLICASVLCCTIAPSSAAGSGNGGAIQPYASGTICFALSANTVTTVGEEFYMKVGETIEYDCTYTPASSSVDFGFIAPDGRFYFINCTNGSIDKSIEVTQRGPYTLVIRNNSSSTVTITGSVTY